MNENVKVIVTGFHKDSLSDTNSEDGDIQTVSDGIYKKIADKEYVKYDEFTYDKKASTCILRFNDEYVELIKKGDTATNMVFKNNEKTKTRYITPHGSLSVVVNTNNIDIKRNISQIVITVNYLLEINGQHVSESMVKIDIQGM